MKIALIGYGKMGKAIEEAASPLGIEVVARLDATCVREWDRVAHADVCIDFSHPKAVLNNMRKLAHLQKPLVIGTSGWYEQIKQVQALVEEYHLGLIYAQNFALGMHLFMRVVAEAAKLFGNRGNYDVALSEIHHRHKVDHPSGTARAIAEVLLRNTKQKKKQSWMPFEGEIDTEALHISSMRVGSVTGIHQVVFDSDQDRITLTHQAHDRSIWAQGALEAARWIRNKKGFFHISDMMEALICND